MTLFEEITEHFSDPIFDRHSRLGDATVILSRDALPGVIRFLREEKRFDFLMDLTICDGGMEKSPRFEAVYHLFAFERKERLRLKVPVEEFDPHLPTLTGEYRNADWLEREAWDMFGVRFDGHPDLRRLLMYPGFEGHPLRKDYPKDRRQPRIGPGSTPATAFEREPALPERLGKALTAAGVADPGEEIMYLNMGPSHPAMHGVVRVMAALKGETITASDVEIGYMHRCFEKEAETHSYMGVIPYTDRLNYVSPLINNVGYVMAVEKLFGVTTPERCRYIRVILSEISRIVDHLTCIGAFAMELGAFTVFLYLMKARESLYELIGEVTGARLTTSYTRIGGLRGDLPPGFDGECRAAFRKIRKDISECDRLLTRNRIFYDRMRGVGVISAADAISFGFTGPCLRASGVSHDVRKSSPYLIYDRLDFEVPLGTEGDNYDRYLVRIAEMEQSMRIVEQALADLPDGPVNLDDRRMTLPPKEEVYNSIEGLMNHFKLIMDGHGIRPPAGEAYFPVEGGNGELGFYVVSDGSGIPARVRVRAPCFHMISALSYLIRGQMIADVVPIFGTLNMIAGELDR
ncbi:MAG: NADH-quinone oxidoreductase subunit D [Deltaproteobacteria bacterium]|nr:NADH-quinone oxidoreductase subunit D [Deltaproteobacteria bacterium]